jgi:BON domain
MAYDEEHARRSRVVVETPDERREVVHTQSVRDNNGISAGMVGVLVVVAIALITMLVLFWLSNQPTTDSTLTAQQQPTVIEQPAPAAQQPPVIIQQPAPVQTQPAPIIVTPPAGGTMPTQSATTTDMDSTVQAAVDKRLTDDPEFSTLGITASVIDGKVMLIGTVKSEELKAKIERAVKQIKGVKAVDNQISVIAE